MHATDDPTAFDRMPRIQRLALLEWIRLVAQPAKTASADTSYWLAAEYERYCGSVSNGAVKRAMQLSGYDPIDPSEANWWFHCRPAGSSKPEQRQLFDRLRDRERQRSAYPLCVLATDPATADALAAIGCFVHVYEAIRWDAALAASIRADAAHVNVILIDPTATVPYVLEPVLPDLIESIQPFCLRFLDSVPGWCHRLTPTYCTGKLILSLRSRGHDPDPYVP